MNSNTFRPKPKYLQICCWYVCMGFWSGVQREPNKILLRNKRLVVKFVLRGIPHICEELGLQRCDPRRNALVHPWLLSSEFQDIHGYFSLPTWETQVAYSYCEAPVADGPVSVCSIVSDFANPWTVARQVLLSMRLYSKNTGGSCHFPIQGIFLTQRWNPHLLPLLHWQVDSLPLHLLGSPMHVCANDQEHIRVNWIAAAQRNEEHWAKQHHQGHLEWTVSKRLDLQNR